MNENKFKLAKTALTITTILTLFVAGSEVLMAISGYQSGMNIFDIATYATAYMNGYCLILILANLILLPFAILLYHQGGISLKKEIADKKTLVRDILFGVGALAVILCRLLLRFVESVYIMIIKKCSKHSLKTYKNVNENCNLY